MSFVAAQLTPRSGPWFRFESATLTSKLTQVRGHLVAHTTMSWHGPRVSVCLAFHSAFPLHCLCVMARSCVLAAEQTILASFIRSTCNSCACVMRTGPSGVGHARLAGDAAGPCHGVSSALAIARLFAMFAWLIAFCAGLQSVVLLEARFQ